MSLQEKLDMEREAGIAEALQKISRGSGISIEQLREYMQKGMESGVERGVLHEGKPSGISKFNL